MKLSAIFLNQFKAYEGLKHWIRTGVDAEPGIWMSTVVIWLCLLQKLVVNLGKTEQLVVERKSLLNML